MNRLSACLKRVLAAAILAFAVVYVGDYILLRYRVAKNHTPYGVVRVRRYYAVATKSGKPDYYFDPPTEATCVRSLFGHLGYSPCWYLRRHMTQEVKM